jgi:hypothetical protein
MKPTSGSQFDDFLYAPIVEESNGTLLTVLSALARVNLNPWDEAARLALLPCEIATTAVVKLIVALPNGLAAGLDAGALARQLVSRLPRYDAARAHPPAPASTGGFVIDRGAVAMLLWIYLVLTLAFLGARWLGGSAQTLPRPDADAPPTSGTASSPTHTSMPVVGSSHRD